MHRAMDKNMLHYVEQELRFVRELGLEFARQFPKVSGRLGLGETSSDPHVERLLQGFAFFAGRVQQKLEAEFPAFTETLLDHIYPHHLKPTPSMAVVRFHPTPNDSSLMKGFVVPRGTELRARCTLAPGSVCHYNTAHAVQLWPITIESVEYTSVLSGIADLHVPAREPIKALLRIGLRLTAGRSFSDVAMRSLPLYVGGNDETSARLYEALVAHAGTIVLRWGPHPARDVAFCEEVRSTRQYGFDDDHALLPGVPSAFRGYRLLHEYFAFPARFRSVELVGLGPGVARCTSSKLELIVPLKQHDPALEGKLGADRLQLFATPAINLFERRVNISIAAHGGEHHELRLVPDRTQPLDMEVHSVTRVGAHTPSRDELQRYARRFEPTPDQALQQPHYRIERRPRVPSEGELQGENRTEYRGSEVYLSLSELRSDARQLVVETLCTNRDLPILLAKDGKSTFTLSSGAPVDEVQVLAGPSTPRYQPHNGEKAWQLIDHLQLNYLSLSERTGGSTAMREILALYAQIGDPMFGREVDGLREIRCQPVIGPYPQPGPRVFVRGLEIHLHCEEEAFSHGVLTLGSVLSHFFARHVSTHSFTQTVLHTTERGEVHRWPAIAGQKDSL